MDTPQPLEPHVMQVDLGTGLTRGFSDEYTKKLSETQDMYQLASEASGFPSGDQGEVSYRVASTTLEGGAGSLTMGITTIEPKIIGNEYMMTRGHLHERPGRLIRANQDDRTNPGLNGLYPGALDSPKC